MAKTRLSDYLFQRIRDAGADLTFGIPGDFVLPHYAAQERCGLKTIVMTHEPSVGFAADAYARLKGLGVALVTYGAGGLNMVNPVALAYAEESPLLIIGGSPETRFRAQKPHLHHCVKSFDTQLNVYREVTESQALITSPALAQQEIDRVIDTTIKLSRPGYLEIPRDMVNCEIDVGERAPSSVEGPSPVLEEAVVEIVRRLEAAVRPVLFAGVEVRRFGIKDQVVALAEALNIPVVTSILGKASFPETHANFIGTYFGQFGNPEVREYVESSDLVFCLGTVLTEMETGGYTARLEATRLIQATAKEVTVSQHSYSGVHLPSLVKEILERSTTKLKPTTRFTIPSIAPEDFGAPADAQELTVASMIDDLNRLIDGSYSIVSDVGDCLYAGLSLRTDVFIAPGYYSTMGFGVPGGIGAALADRSRRPIILVGDGGFQMTGMEISTAVKLGLGPIVIVFNNASYAMLRFFDQEREYYNLSRWDYAALARAVGGQGEMATTRAEFQAALKHASESSALYLIDCLIAEDDISPTLKRLTDHFGRQVRAAIAAPAK